ncbi:MAG: sirohydrochlorin cobaltochelatase, partial [Spirochaetales bacterium]|nr:sirohydrochlorin cobaltochelatase [Spirochaetales bacterium]
MKDKKGILVVSFGTTHKDTELKCINPIETAVKKIFKDFEIRRAFTSNIIIRKLGVKGIYLPSPLEAVEKMLEEGFTHLIVQPLLFIKGHEFHNKILEPLLPYRKRFSGLSIGEPLLSEESDFGQMVTILSNLSASVNGEDIVMMGHGST